MIVVTGAAGLIGSAIVRYLNDQGIQDLILVDDVKLTNKWKNLTRKKFLHFLSKHQLFEWLKGKENQIKAFLHLGACSDTMEQDGSYLLENNYQYTIQLAEYALKHGQRFIYASSAATYGDGSMGFSDDHDMLDQLKPLNLYGFSKHLFDLWAKRQGVLNQIVGLKYFNVFGPNEQHKGRMASFIFQKFPNALQNEPIKLFKSNQPELFSHGNQSRDFIYVKDVARITCGFLKNIHGGIFNIGSGVPTTWNDLASALFKSLDLAERIEYVDMPPQLSRQYQNFTCADMSKYCNTLGIDSSVPDLQFNVQSAVSDYVRNFLLKDEQW